MSVLGMGRVEPWQEVKTMADANWTTLRIRPGTAAAVRALADRLVAHYESGGDVSVSYRDRAPGQKGSGVSADEVVQMLLRFYHSHKERARKSRARKAESKLDKPQSEVYTLEDGVIHGPDEVSYHESAEPAQSDPEQRSQTGTDAESE